MITLKPASYRDATAGDTRCRECHYSWKPVEYLTRRRLRCRVDGSFFGFAVGQDKTCVYSVPKATQCEAILRNETKCGSAGPDGGTALQTSQKGGVSDGAIDAV